MDVILLVLGIGLLFGGGELLVRNASLLARAFGLSPLVIGLTVVAFGTSAPELAASVTAALQGSPEIAIGNVVGSNIANVALILGLVAVLAPVRAEANFLRREMPILILVSFLLAGLLLDGRVGRVEGILFVASLVAYLVLLLRPSDEPPQVEEEFAEAYGAAARTPAWRSGLGALAGLAVLVLGARLLVGAATGIARELGVPELVIGVTVVAVGTSLPELAASVIAALRREPDLALGNVVGSNIFNVLGILGITTLVRPIELPFGAVAADLVAMLAAALLLWPFLITGRRLGRVEGGVLLALYAAYVGWRFL